MPKAKRPAKGQPADADPDRLVRQAAGTYRSADERFEVRGGAGTGWFLVDGERANDFGQELILGPYATLDAVRGAIPSAREAKLTPIRRPKAAASKGGAGSSAAKPAKPAKRPEPPKPKPTWIDGLEAKDAASVRRRIAALERAGVRDAEALVRRDREGIGSAVATRLIERRLEEIVAELPERGRAGARELLRRAAEILSADGLPPGKDLPGWSLVEVDRDEPSNRRITVRELPG